MYSPGEASQITGIPSSTLRRYVVEFGDHLSQSAKKQRGREFSDRDISILIEIRNLAQDGLTLDKIGEQLTATVEHEPEGETEPPAQTALVLINHIGQQLKSVSGQLSQIQTDQTEQRSEIETLKEQVSEIDQLKEQISQLSAALEQERKKSFWDRLRGR